MTIDAVVTDRFLDGRLELRQPRDGYRAATDPVLLAAAVPAEDGHSVLDIGCGVGTAALCLGHRVPGLDLHGLEVQAEYAALARANAMACGIRMTVHDGDLRAMQEPLKQMSFNAVLMNPPWHDEASHASPDPGRDRANRLDVEMTVWISAALTRLLPGGWLVLIQRIERLPDILSAMQTRTGDISVLPLAARTGRAAKRVIVKARKGARSPFRLAAPLVLHDGASHDQDGDDYSAAARAVLRDGAPLEF